MTHDYSNYGAAEYTRPQETDTESTSKESSKPAVNDYSSYGAAEYGSSDDTGETSGAANATDSSANTVASDSPANGTPYEVDCNGSTCKANPPVVAGYEKFVGHCSQCHGETAEGSTFAPSLVQRLQGMDKQQFIQIVTNGKTTQDPGTGTYAVMPPWGGNKSVMGNIDNIWAFLKARSDGALKAGRPESM
ncbi:c-type cytochrome [Halomonas sp. WWR20]